MDHTRPSTTTSTAYSIGTLLWQLAPAPRAHYRVPRARATCSSSPARYRPHADHSGREVELKALALAPVASARQEEQDALLVAQRHPGLVPIAHEQERLDHPDERVAARTRPIVDRDLDVFRSDGDVRGSPGGQDRSRRAASGQGLAGERSVQRDRDRLARRAFDATLQNHGLTQEVAHPGRRRLRSEDLRRADPLGASAG